MYHIPTLPPSTLIHPFLLYLVEVPFLFYLLIPLLILVSVELPFYHSHCCVCIGLCVLVGTPLACR
jgi:hypothetical protein